MMRKMILAALVVILAALVVVYLGVAQAQSADPSPTPRTSSLDDLTAIAARQTAAARPPAVRPEVPINTPAPKWHAVAQTEGDPEDVDGGAPPGVGEGAPPGVGEGAPPGVGGDGLPGVGGDGLPGVGGDGLPGVGGDAPGRPNPSPTSHWNLWRFPVSDAAPDPNASPTPFWSLALDATAIAAEAARATVVAGGAAGPGDGAPPSPLEQTGAVHRVGEDIPLIDAAATALHQMAHSPADAPRAFSSGCELPPRDRAHAAACDAYKAAYELKYGNPCRHNEEGAVVCLH